MKRILTAIVALPILLYTVWSPTPYFFVALIAVVVVLALAEFYSLASNVGAKPQGVLGYAGSLLVVASFVYDEPRLMIAVLIALAICSLAAGVFKPDEIKQSLASVSSTVFGVIYIAVLAGCLAGVRMIPDTSMGSATVHLSSKLITTFFAIVMMTDTGAYYTGRAIGRNKLAPKISPGKTIEGAIGGFAAAVASGPLCKLIFFHELPLAHALLLGAAIGIIGQSGDLAESMLKRSANVKDSGKLLPGHGGVLDRIDSILFCAPLLYFYARLFAGRF
jgi:phosphatidate cytidylyltransferase